ncbi:hypothetical protein BDN67DRAFT_981611 [Paxillus ammoniavirescens]|nr:hypothetical protein BDN67DRAFT_981611 [Paxillus ammoniavirescens]
MEATNHFTGLGQIPPGLGQMTSGLQYGFPSLQQIPAGFYVNVLIENKEYRTTNKPAIANGGMSKWKDYLHFLCIGIPSSTAAHVFDSSIVLMVVLETAFWIAALIIMVVFRSQGQMVAVK